MPVIPYEQPSPELLGFVLHPRPNLHAQTKLPPTLQPRAQTAILNDCVMPSVAPSYARPLTRAPKREIMVGPGIRNVWVSSFAPNSIEEHHERLQPQGGRRVGTRQQDGRRGCRTDRE